MSDKEHRGAKTFHPSLDWILEKRSNYTSQYGEDGILQAIFEKIGTKNKHCLEVGASDGLFFSNTRRLIHVDGWSAILLESDIDQFRALARLYGFDHERVGIGNIKVEPSGPNTLDSHLGFFDEPKDIDLIVIDVDGDDLYLANSLIYYKPRVLMVEYNYEATDPYHWPEYGSGKQAGYMAVCNVMRKHNAGEYGYVPIVRTETNIIFVRQDAVGPLVNQEIAKALMEQEEAKKEPEIRVAAILSCPRIGWNDTWGAIHGALSHFKIPLSLNFGAFWSQCLTRGIEKTIEKHNPTHILTIDYDSVFRAKDIGDLVLASVDYPEYDIFAPLQVKRDGQGILANVDGPVDLTKPIVEMKSAHFGLTLIRASIFEKLPRPWFLELPNEDGRWEEGRTDSDIYFWGNCEKNGIRAALVPSVSIGHLQTVIAWPNVSGESAWCTAEQWWTSGCNPIPLFENMEVQDSAQAV